jgi:hypothetical protein
MPSVNLERVLEEVRGLTPAERQELRARFEAWPTPSRSAEDDLDPRLMAADDSGRRLTDGGGLPMIAPGRRGVQMGHELIECRPDLVPRPRPCSWRWLVSAQRQQHSLEE